MDKLDSVDHLASLIRFHRRQAGVSQVDLASLAGVSRKVIQDLEAGKDGVSWRNLAAVLRVLNVALQPVGPLVERWSDEVDKRAPEDEAAKGEEV